MLKHRKLKNSFKFDLNVMKSIVKMTDDYYKARNVSNMFLVNVIQHISRNSSFLNLKESY